MDQANLTRFRKELNTLLLQMFTPHDFRCWLQEVHGDRLLYSLPNNPPSQDMFVYEAVEALLRLQAFDEAWFKRLKEPPRDKRSREIDAIHALWNAATSRLPEETDKVMSIFGGSDGFQLLNKIVGRSFVKSTKAMEVSGGCVVRVSTRERNPDGGWSVAEALTFVPNVKVAVVHNDTGEIVGRVLVAAGER